MDQTDDYGVFAKYPSMQSVRTYIQLSQFKTIDCLVEYAATRIKDPTNKFIYQYLIDFESSLVLSILKSETNIPSVHDLHIINQITTSGFIDQHRSDISNSILNIYKTRKVIS